MSVVAHRVQMDNICRTCLSQDQNMKSVFDTDRNSGESLQLFEMLMACTSVQVQEDDGLPPKICLTCINHLARSYTFTKLCEDSDATLRKVLEKGEIIDYTPLIQIKQSKNVSLFSQETHVDIDTDPLDIAMKFEEGETNIDDLTSYTDYSVCEKKDVRNATIESKNDFDIKSDDIKVELMHDQIELEANTLITNNEMGNIECSRPNETEQPIYHCEQCNACFTVEDDLKIHLDTHGKLTKHKCTVCSEELVNSSQLGRHMMMHDKTRRHVCSECGKRFRTRFSLRTHSITHTDEKPFLCKVCDKRFKRVYTLDEHMRAHANEKRFICFECGKGYTHRATFLMHLKLHRDSTPTICCICDKRYRDARVLRVHMKTHAGEKEHVCSDCGKAFTMATSLRRHQRLHTGERPYVCSVCNKGFRHSSYLAQHVRTHSPALFTCIVCDREFRMASKLKQHMRVHMGR